MNNYRTIKQLKNQAWYDLLMVIWNESARSSNWEPIDLMTAIFFVASFFFLRKNK